MVASGAGWTILTPLALHHAARFRAEVDLQPLPFEPLARTLSLLPGALFSFIFYPQTKIYSQTCDGAHEPSGSTPRTPGVAASGTEHVYKVAPGGDYDTGNSEYSSSDDDTSYGGKQA